MKAILWDNDGVLVDTEGLYFDVTRDALAELGIGLSEADFAEYSLRRGVSVFELALELGHDAREVERTRERRNTRYSERLRGGVELIPGVADTLTALSAVARMAVVTSSQPENFALQHARTGIRERFELVLTGADFTRFKPDPEPYLLAAARLGVAPADCLVIEDSERGLVSAQRAGMRCVAIPRGLSRAGNFASAYRLLERVEDLVPIVRSLV
jgi:HAD superfamily hydrolase (TIGR01509 family)